MSIQEPDRELRYAVAPITSVEVRDPTGNYDNTWTMSGYAAVFDDPTVLYDSQFLKVTESISPDAFDRVLRDQGLDQPAGVVHLNFGHDMNRAVAATNVTAGEPGSLELRADKPKGLYFQAKVARDDPDGIALASKMRTGVVSQASFAFTIGRADYQITESDDGPELEHRTIQELSHLYDVCACAQGAYSSTVSQLRSLAVAIGQPWHDLGGQRRQTDPEGASDINPDAEGVAATPIALEWPDLSEDLNRYRSIPVDRT